MIVNRFVWWRLGQLSPLRGKTGSIQASQHWFSTDGDGSAKQSAPTLCQVNNHPNYRLKQAKARFAASNDSRQIKQLKSKPKQIFTSPKRERLPPRSLKYHTTVKEHGISVQINENPEIRNDGTSSGAIAAERLRIARRKAIENMARHLEDTTPRDASTAHEPCQILDAPVKEHGLDIIAYENPVRTNDGTSSGAVAADRLRMARRRALESMRLPSESADT
jgi:hypothetical protein